MDSQTQLDLAPFRAACLSRGRASRSRGRRVAVLAALGFLVTAGCGDDGTSGPDDGQQAFSFSFETGFEGWEPDSADFCDGAVAALHGASPCGAGSAFAHTEITISDEHASAGSRSIELFGENFTDAVKVWIERRFDVTPGATYQVDVRWDFGTQDGDVGAWQLIAAATPFDPDAGFRTGTPEGFVGDFERLGETTSPTGAFTFVEKSYQRAVTAGAPGEIWVGIGVWGTFEVARTYFVDDVRVTLSPDEPLQGATLP